MAKLPEPAATLSETRRWSPSPLLYGSAALHLGAAVTTLLRPGVWPWALGAVVVNHVALSAAGLWPRAGLLGPNLTQLPEDCSDAVAITIDDGPDPAVTPRVLDLLEQAGASATFFCIGERVLRYAALAQQIVQRGHAIENHSQHHRHHFSLLGPRAMHNEIAAAQASICRVTGMTPRFFRAPAGLRNPFLDPVLHGLALQLASWTRRGFDTVTGDAERVHQRLSGRPGGSRYPAAARWARGAWRGRSAGHPRSAAAPARRLRRAQAQARDAAGGGMKRAAPLLLSAYTASSCIGTGNEAAWQTLARQRSGLKACDFETSHLQTFIGEVAGVDAWRLPESFESYECRNNRLSDLALAQDGIVDAVQRAVARYGAARVGVFVGTSTAGILQTELAYRRLETDGALPPDFHYAHTHNSYAAAGYVRERLGLQGPAIALSSACASSAKVFGSAQRMLEAGLIDAALVGGVDSLCLTTLYGFHSLQLSSPSPCRPFDVARDGISIGEAAAFVLLERVPDSLDAKAVLLLGVGESSDAHHMSAPHPEGLGARRAMQTALQQAGLAAGQIDYINLHGTGTPSNDRSESQAVTSVFGESLPCSSTKGATGHTLGAAGALEAVISALSHPPRQHARGRAHRIPRPGPHRALSARQPARAGGARAQQFLRLRRRELQPDIRFCDMTLTVYVNGIGVRGPGLAGWHSSAAVLAGREAYGCAATLLPALTMLSPTDRRRTGRVIRVALAVALEATAAAGAEGRDVPSVFSSSGSDGQICHEICSALATPEREVSPTRFSNSVHNAPAGYWSIATGNMAAANVLCGHDASFVAGLLDAAAQACAEVSRCCWSASIPSIRNR